MILGYRRMNPVISALKPRSFDHVFRTVKPYMLIIDVSVACVCFLIRMTVHLGDPLLIIVALGMAAALAIHRLSPSLSLGVAWATVVVQLALQLPPDISNAAILVVLFATSAYGSRAVRWLGFSSAVVGALVATLYLVSQGFVSSIDWSNFVSSVVGQLPRIGALFIGGFAASVVLFLLSWTVGLLWHTFVDAQASARARVLAEQQQQNAQRDVAIEQERTRIARDMHDVVAHSLAVVIAQADGARYAAASDPSAADGALSTISTTAREALGDVRMLLAQLRHAQPEGPQPVLADLDRLIGQFESSGLTVRRETVGTAHPLGTAQQLAAYRIVQESMTNALRHADTAAEVVVTFTWLPATVDIAVSSGLLTPNDDGGTSATGQQGHGIDGMRERAVLAGGTLTAEPRGEHFIVTATLPLSLTPEAS